MATKTAVIVLCDEAVLIWAIPPLSPQPPDFFDHNPTHMPPPLFTIPFPDISRHPVRIGWKAISSWHLGSSHPLYFDMLCQDSKLHRFQIMLQPDLSTASLHVINTSEHTPHDFGYVLFQDYRICEDALVYFWRNHKTWGAHIGLTSAPFTNVVTRWQGYMDSLCPTSGRSVYRIGDGDKIVVVDLF